jgi:hypothetical protein
MIIVSSISNHQLDSKLTSSVIIDSESFNTHRDDQPLSSPNESTNTSPKPGNQHFAGHIVGEERRNYTSHFRHEGMTVPGNWMGIAEEQRESLRATSGNIIPGNWLGRSGGTVTFAHNIHTSTRVLRHFSLSTSTKQTSRFVSHTAPGLIEMASFLSSLLSTKNKQTTHTKTRVAGTSLCHHPQNKQVALHRALRQG